MSINSLFLNAKKIVAELEELSVESVTEMLDNLLKTVLKKNPADKKKKDENKPKRALNSYMQYCKAVRKTVQEDEDNKDKKPKEITSLIAGKWRALSDDEKLVYIEMFEKEKSDIESGKEKSESESEPKKTIKKVTKKVEAKKADTKKAEKKTKKIVPKKIIEESDSEESEDSN